MHWPKKLAVSTWQSLWGPLTGTPIASPTAANQPALALAHARLRELRQAMLDAVAPHGEVNLRHVDVMRKLLHARSIEALWYARSDVMVALASEHGEAAARATLAGLTARFNGLLPEADNCKSQPSLSRRH